MLPRHVCVQPSMRSIRYSYESHVINRMNRTPTIEARGCDHRANHPVYWYPGMRIRMWHVARIRIVTHRQQLKREILRTCGYIRTPWTIYQRCFMIAYMTMLTDRYLLSTRLRIRTIRSANGARTRDYSRYRIRAIDLAIAIECSSGTRSSRLFQLFSLSSRNEIVLIAALSWALQVKGTLLKSKSLYATRLCISNC